MAYVLNKLTNMPINDDVNLYIFVVSSGFRDPDLDVIEDNFFEIARSIGDHAVIAVGTDKESFSTSVAKHYLGKDKSDSSFTNMLPALIITNSHPDELTSDSLRLVVPLRCVKEKFGGWQTFFSSLSRFALGESNDFLNRFDSKENLLDAANKVISLKPGAFGFAINLNEIIERLLKSRAAQKR